MTSPLLAPTANRDLAFSGWLDVFRALAAFAVFYGHARTLFLASVTPGQSLDPTSRALYFLSNYGHQAVVVFIVLSGYLLGGSVVRKFREGRWSWGDFAFQRGTRLYVVLVPALLLTLCWDYGEMLQSAGLTPNDDTAVANIGSDVIRRHTTPATFAGNLLFLQPVVVPSLGSNTVLWSLSNEVRYYLAFPILLFAVTRTGVKLSVRLVLGTLAVLMLTVVGKSVALFFVVWLLGALASTAPEWAWLRDRRRRRLASASVAATLVAFLVALGARQLYAEWMEDLVLAVTFATLLYCLKHDRLPPSSLRLRRVAAFFADFSFTLYLVHLPPLIFLRACLTYEVAWQPGPGSWAKLALILVGILGYAYLVSLATERQTERLRRWLRHRFAVKRVAADNLSAFEAKRCVTLSKSPSPQRASVT